MHIGSFLCADSKDKLVGPGQKPITIEVDKGKDKDKDEKKDTVRLQFRKGFDEYTRDDVKLGEMVDIGK